MAAANQVYCEKLAKWKGIDIVAVDNISSQIIYRHSHMFKIDSFNFLSISKFIYKNRVNIQLVLKDIFYCLISKI